VRSRSMRRAGGLERALRFGRHVARRRSVEPERAQLVVGKRAAPIGRGTRGEGSNVRTAQTTVRARQRVRQLAAKTQVDHVSGGRGEDLGCLARGEEVVARRGADQWNVLN
jgi:hypothetical protein